MRTEDVGTIVERDTGGGGEPRVLMVTSEWPTPAHPNAAPFIVRQVRYLRAAGATVDVLHFRGAKDPANYLRAWFAARRAIRAGSYDLVHAQFGQAGAVVAWPKRLPLVVTFRGSDLEGIVGPDGRYTRIGKVLQRVSRRVARRADAVIVVSSSLARLLPRAPDAVIPSGLDRSLFVRMSRERAREELGVPGDDERVLFVGDPANARKRFSLAREAAARAGAELVVAWDMPHERIPLYMNACDALIFTSMHEGSPNVVKEALACGLPVVSVDVGDVRERLEGLADCVLCEDDNPETLGRALRAVLDRRGRVDAGEVTAKLDEAVLTQQVLGVYRAALGKAAPR